MPRYSAQGFGDFMRSSRQVKQAVDKWLQHVRPRAWDFFIHEGQIREVLETVASNTDRNYDPILETKCSLWHGSLDEYNEATHRMDVGCKAARFGG